ncbi:MAG: 16S rRNA (guanine(527)-N(7))-methyltransferase RsmG [Candidatus Abyssobacteria bacterium SURF_17]|jgi:16S rRNA (guanine527-N7)-methyltransferase|uniref:Ribosomal RNA small subunit methyltransferase G n=1 Tax=Candidatus Abyssobacteria bacterium SURF_17 TaxID=2093361 RepID=A0A419EXM3_9BACT|nr:MAG: 16S rRNA (guanine(527)-N(7))-methyltransferase RsmG [Candidatus Abyssubacteria bacterium SURF_17]
MLLGMRELFRHTLRDEAARLDITLSSEQLDTLCAHYALLQKWNPRIRLVGTTEPTRAARELFADSLVAARFAERVAATPHSKHLPRVLDIGSGAGLPGMIIKILQPQWSITIIELQAKRVSFLKMLTHELRVENAVVFHGRAEALAHEEGLREQFDVAFCRAVASPATACELAIPFVRVDGWFIGQMGEFRREGDVAGLRRAAAMLGSTIDVSMSYNLPGTVSPRSLIAFRKILPTSSSYPRSMRKMRKAPLF